MTAERNPARGVTDREAAGLCASCANSRRVVSAKGSVFWLCGLAERDAAFPRYPRLPVIRCPGYIEKERRS
jgi:hypothetical protein